MVTNAIMQEMETMSEESRQEVFDFVLFLKSRLRSVDTPASDTSGRTLDVFQTDGFFMAEDFDETPDCFAEYM